MGEFERIGPTQILAPILEAFVGPSSVPPSVEPSHKKRGRPVGAKDAVRRDNKKRTGADRLRGAQSLAIKNEIRIMREAGSSVAQIVDVLKLAKGAVIRNLYATHTPDKLLIQQIIEEATIDSLLILAEGLETLKTEVQQMKVKSAAGELNLTPEQLGTMLRGMEKTHDLIRLMDGRGVSAFKDGVLEKKDSRLNAAAVRLSVLQAQGVDVSEAERG